MWNILMDVECNDLVSWDLFEANWAGAVEGAKVTTGTGWGVFIQAGVGMVQRVL